MTKAIHTISEHGTNLPVYKAVQNKQHEYLLTTCLPKTDLYHLGPMEDHRKLLHTSINAGNIDRLLRIPRKCINMVPPSSMARIYIHLNSICGEIITRDHRTK